jgi:transketolase
MDIMETDLGRIAGDLRIDIIEMLHKAGSGHAGGSLSAVEILTVLYFKVMRIDPSDFHMEGRDRFILSKGHAAPALYAVLAKRGYFGKAVLQTLRQTGSMLQGHPDMKKTPGVDFSSGSLGQGLSVGCGMAWGLKNRKINSNVYVLLGDGELNEGQIWEAAMAAVKFKVGNLIAIVDHNGVQLDGTTNVIMPMEDIPAKWRAFGWHVTEVDGHDFQSLIDTFENIKCIKDKPNVIIARTVKGKGVSFMENDYRWHGRLIDDKDFEKAIEELSLII